MPIFSQVVEGSSLAKTFLVRDYLETVQEPTLTKQLGQIHSSDDSSCERLRNFSNLKRLLQLLQSMYHLQVLSKDTLVAVQDGAQTLSVAKIVTGIEKTYLHALIGKFMQSESQRMFEYLNERTASVFD